MGGILDWISWIAGGLLAAGGLILLVWALFWDRPRGRRRCPKCWYDMTATTGLRCNECGHTAKREKKLRKTRRHLWQARLAVLIFLLGATGLALPRARRGPENIVPTTALIYLMPDLVDYWPAGGTELTERLVDGRVWSWQWRWLINRCYKGDRGFRRVRIETPDRWPQGVGLAGNVSIARTGLTVSLPLWPLRTRIEPRFDRNAEPLLRHSRDRWSPRQEEGDEPAWRRAEPLGMPPRRGFVELEYDVIVERGRREPAGTNPVGYFNEVVEWQVIHKKRVSVSLVVDGALEEYIQPDDSVQLTDLLQRRVGFLLDNQALRLIAVHDEPIPDGMTLPIVIELLRDGEAVHEWLVWWDVPGPEPWAGRDHRFSQSVRGADRPFGTADYARYSWSVRISGDPRRAVLNEEAQRFWSGSFEVPLTLVDTPDELLYRSE
ncbi:MAG: hypothetical protein ACYS0D_08780 [Planctomycetota bacterium]